MLWPWWPHVITELTNEIKLRCLDTPGSYVVGCKQAAIQRWPELGPICTAQVWKQKTSWFNQITMNGGNPVCYKGSTMGSKLCISLNFDKKYGSKYDISLILFRYRGSKLYKFSWNLKQRGWNGGAYVIIFIYWVPSTITPPTPHPMEGEMSRQGGFLSTVVVLILISLNHYLSHWWLTVAIIMQKIIFNPWSTASFVFSNCDFIL